MILIFPIVALFCIGGLFALLIAYQSAFENTEGVAIVFLITGLIALLISCFCCISTVNTLEYLPVVTTDNCTQIAIGYDGTIHNLSKIFGRKIDSEKVVVNKNGSIMLGNTTNVNEWTKQDEENQEAHNRRLAR